MKALLVVVGGWGTWGCWYSTRLWMQCNSPRVFRRVRACVRACDIPASETLLARTLIAWRISDVTWQRETGTTQSQGQRLGEGKKKRRHKKRRARDGGVARRE